MNYLHGIKRNFETAKLELAKAMELIASGDNCSSQVNALQSLKVDDSMAEVFRDKPVVLIQTMNVNILQINNRINAALRALDKIDNAALRTIGTVPEGQFVAVSKKGRFAKIKKEDPHG